MRPLPDEIRKQIDTYIKNGVDISDLIKDYNIKGMDLSGAIIKNLNKINEDMEGTNFARAVIGEEGKINNISGSILRNCIFKETRFLGTIRMRRCDFTGSNFSNAYMPYVEYQHSKFFNCTFCDTVFRIGSRVGLGAEFDKNLFQELTKHWSLSVEITPKQSKEQV